MSDVISFLMDQSFVSKIVNKWSLEEDYGPPAASILPSGENARAVHVLLTGIYLTRSKYSSYIKI